MFQNGAVPFFIPGDVYNKSHYENYHIQTILIMHMPISLPPSNKQIMVENYATTDHG